MSAPIPWQLKRGATVLQSGGVRFSVWAPCAKTLAIRLGDGADHAAERRAHGEFDAIVPSAHAGSDYQLVLDGECVRPDPVSRCQPDGIHGPSRVIDPFSFRWTDSAWRGRPLAEYVIYELHVGTFTDEGTFDAAIEHLDELASLGITAVELMPVAQFPGARNWGYDGVLLYAVQNTYGGPDSLRRFVDAAHARGLAVILDVVYNHIGPEGNYFGDFGPYFTETYRTAWGPAINYDGAGSDEVRRYVVDNALHWITEYHIDALRLDAIHAIYDFSSTHILADIAASCRRLGEALGRHIVVIGESDLNDPKVVREPERGGYGLHGQWSDDFHHAIHAELTGERGGYYADFGGILPIAKALRERFVYDGRYSASRDRRHGAPALDVPGDRFVVCIQNHDQVGNRGGGERLSALVPYDKLKLAAALLLLSPYVPLLFMGEEYGEPRPFQYFVSHGDPELVRSVREGRRREFERFEWGDGIPDPVSDATFLASRLDRSSRSTTSGSALRELYRSLLELRRTEAPLRPGMASDPIVDHDDRERTLSLELRAESRAIRSLFNLSNEFRTLKLPPHIEPTPVLDTDDPRFRGEGRTRMQGDAVTLGPFTAAVFRGAARRGWAA